MLDAITINLIINIQRSASKPKKEIKEADMLKTLRALRAPEFHCFIYPSIVGFTESANLPMMGIVQLSPGRFFFLYRYTDCSRARRAKMMATVVYVAAFEADESS